MGSTPNCARLSTMKVTIISVGGLAPLTTKSRGLLQDIVGAFGFREFGSQPAVFCFQVDRLDRGAGPGFFVLADPHAQRFLNPRRALRRCG